MSVSKEELKKRACDAIDKNREQIIALGESIYVEPELGFKEFKTAEKIKRIFDELGYAYRDGIARTGVVAPLKGKSSKLKIAVMGELDAVIAPGQRCANPETGAAHSCGHNAMIASLAGVAYALKDTGIMEELDGDIVLMAVPAEEYVEIEYRNSLREAGEIHFLGGKQEFIRLGEMDDIDIMIMQHLATTTHYGKDTKAVTSYTMNGFIGKMVQYTGKGAHAAGAPHLGINALSAANVALHAIGLLRETFREKDNIRVHPIITKGGDLVNTVPADVRLESYVRGSNVDAIVETNQKVNRAFEAGALAIGAEVKINDLPGYMPMLNSAELTDIVYENMKHHIPEENILKYGPGSAGSSDAGDISNLMPIIHSHFCGVEGIPHGDVYEIVDKELCYITTAKTLVMTAIDLLYDDAKVGLNVKEKYKPTMTKEEYLEIWGNIGK